ncbi:MAG: class F sortase [Patescibacteria group bacterium]
MTAGFLLLLLAVITFHLTRLVSSNLEQTSKLPSNEHPSANSILEQKSSRQRQDQDEDRAKETTEMPSATPSVPPTPTATPTNIPTPTPAIGQPTYIQIPSIGVDAYVEETGYNAEGTTMDVPQDPVNTAWFNAGPVPGYRGNAVIAGHYDNALGQPAAFWYLNQVQIGDDVIIYDNLGQRLRFVVTDVQTYHISNVPLQEIFGSTNSKQLNLITCGGYWDIGANTYSDRTVVYSEFTEEIE